MHVYKKQYHKAQVNQQKKFYEEYINKFSQESYCPQRNEKGEILRINFYKSHQMAQITGT